MEEARGGVGLGGQGQNGPLAQFLHGGNLLGYFSADYGVEVRDLGSREI